jgi:hypothetical protein
VLGNGDALDKMVQGLQRNCGNASTNAGGIGAQSLSPLDGPSPTSGTAESPEDTAKIEQRQKEFAEFFLKALDQKYGSQLQRSDKPFPWEPGGDDDSAGSGKSAAACSVGYARSGGQGAIAALLALGLILGARARKSARAAWSRETVDRR